MSEVVLALSGPIKSGKSTLAVALGRSLGWRVAGFGNTVRSEARRRGIAESREALQALGEELVGGDSVEFCKATLAQAEWTAGAGVVIDGVRHRAALDALRLLVQPASLVLVFVNVADSTRLTRAAQSGISAEALRAMDRHSTEVQVRTVLRSAADLELDAELAVEDLVRTVRARLGI